jgi:hypothetical protein
LLLSCNQRKKVNRVDQLEGIMNLIKYKLKSPLTLRKSILTFPNHILSCLEFSSEHYFLEVKKIRLLSKHDWRNLSLSLFIRISFARKMFQNLFKREMVLLQILIIFYLQIMISSCKDDFLNSHLRFKVRYHYFISKLSSLHCWNDSFWWSNHSSSFERKKSTVR